MGRKSLRFVFGIFLAVGTVLAHYLGGFPNTSERLGRDSEGNDLPAESLEGVLKAGGKQPPTSCRSAGVEFRRSFHQSVRWRLFHQR